MRAARLTLFGKPKNFLKALTVSRTMLPKFIVKQSMVSKKNVEVCLTRNLSISSDLESLDLIFCCVPDSLCA